jgi:diguanylate cyclase (GGDEF)-like protein
MVGMPPDPALIAGDAEVRPEDRSPAESRDRVADGRDLTSELYDRAAEARDDRARSRDDEAEGRDQRQPGPGAASDRNEALRDRWGAGSDRAHAAADRKASWSDRAASAKDRTVASIDPLTGARNRAPGILELKREMARAKRTKQPFVLAFIDVDGLKATNDSFGHAAGDRRLRQTADTIRAHLRSYDLLVRIGGDEFVCGLLDLRPEQAAARFAVVNADLAKSGQESVSVGLAELEAEDAFEDLIGRADLALYHYRDQRSSSAG